MKVGVMNRNESYEILGLTPDCTLEEIKAAYRKQAKEWHPDVNSSPEATEKFKEIQQAYETLTSAKNAQGNDYPPFDEIFVNFFNKKNVDNIWRSFNRTTGNGKTKVELYFENLSNDDFNKMLRTIKDAGFNATGHSISRGTSV
jgi:molecular chaperone DnaJ